MTAGRGRGGLNEAGFPSDRPWGMGQDWIPVEATRMTAGRVMPSLSCMCVAAIVARVFLLLSLSCMCVAAIVARVFFLLSLSCTCVAVIVVRVFFLLSFSGPARESSPRVCASSFRRHSRGLSFSPVIPVEATRMTAGKGRGGLNEAGFPPDRPWGMGQDWIPAFGENDDGDAMLSGPMPQDAIQVEGGAD